MTVDIFLKLREEHEGGLTQLRGILKEAGLTETVKWNFPVYTLDNKNIAGLGSFKSYFGIWFFQGALLKDVSAKLINAQEGKTQAMRQWRFNSEDELDIELVKQYILEAINNHKKGLEVKPDRKPLVIPDILKEALSANAHLAELFDELNLTRKREFAEYISEAKREQTKRSRLDKIKPMILAGKGLNDKYR